LSQGFVSGECLPEDGSGVILLRERSDDESPLVIALERLVEIANIVVVLGSRDHGQVELTELRALGVLGALHQGSYGERLFELDPDLSVGHRLGRLRIHGPRHGPVLDANVGVLLGDREDLIQGDIVTLQQAQERREPNGGAFVLKEFLPVGDLGKVSQGPPARVESKSIRFVGHSLDEGRQHFGLPRLPDGLYGFEANARLDVVEAFDDDRGQIAVGVVADPVGKNAQSLNAEIE